MSNINIQSQIIGTYGFLKPFDTTVEYVNVDNIKVSVVEEIEVEVEVCQ
jgi:hypothetical protein